MFLLKKTHGKTPPLIKGEGLFSRFVLFSYFHAFSCFLPVIFPSFSRFTIMVLVLRENRRENSVKTPSFFLVAFSHFLPFDLDKSGSF